MSADAPTLWDLGEQLTRAFVEVEAILETNGGEYTSEVAALIDGVEEEWEDKALRTAFYAERRIPIEVDGIDREMRRLKARKRALAKRRAWLRETYLPGALARQGRTHVHSALLTLKIGKGRARVVCDVAPEFLDPDYVRSKRVVEVDKTAVLAAHKAGKQLPDGLRVEEKPVAKVS